MHPQLLPTIAAPSPGNEDDGSVVAVEKREDFSEKINLDLGIGICGCANEKIKQEERQPFLTKPQFYEFHNPTLVCNPITFGLPLFIGFCPKSSGHTSSKMDTEPGRCRRTDGRKWRCTKSVIPHQKYCERHMNRGRRASRTHTSTPIEGVPISGTKTSEDNRNLVAMSNPSNLDRSQPHSNCSSNGGSAIFRDKSDENSDGLSAIPRKIINRVHTVAKNDYVAGFVSPRFGSSPKSVLHSNAGSKSITETSLQRCQRTDGKKWQCRKDVVPNQKYCELHMHRGAKRIVSNLKSSGKVLETSTRRARISCTASFDSSINLNIVAANPQRHFTENKSTSSSTSDATTITD